MFQFQTDPRKLKERIKRYEAALQKEFKKFRYISDGSGKRYVIGPMYLLLGDVPGAVRSFKWFEKTFPDDIGEPFHWLCWALALYQSNDRANAARILRRAMLSNLYLLPALLGTEPLALEVRRRPSWEDKAYVEQGPLELFQLWDEQALAWARELYQSEGFRKARERSIEIIRLLETEPVGPKRSALVDELFTLRNSG
ncbi:MAG: hypothetical protein JW892_09290 [Anaerolineae bacterium]|nr:hypothetical protein [Anaerolineae bacterium]